VLQALQKPFEEPADPKLWYSQLDNVKPDKIFMRLIDYSKNEFGEPGYDPADNELYVVTELAQQSLKDYVDKRREESAPPSKETVRSLAKAIILVMAGLHAKGFVHLDMKPENLMIFDGRLKLIDVDGCVEIGSSISIDDDSISFSPCYCSPEWASFLINHRKSPDIRADPDLDVWSVGCTICELITLDTMMRPAWKKYKGNTRTGRAKFMQWLSKLEEPHLPHVVQSFDDELATLLTNCLMVPSPSERRTCAESLDVPYLASDKLMRTKSSPIKAHAFEEDMLAWEPDSDDEFELLS
jgi:serine/threonine protein kinase